MNGDELESWSNDERTFLMYGAFKIGIAAIKSQFSCKYLTDSYQIYMTIQSMEISTQVHDV